MVGETENRKVEDEKNTMERYMDASLTPEERAKDLLAKMNLEEKMAQTYTIFPWAVKPLDEQDEETRESAKYGVGGVSTLIFRQIPTLEEAAQFQRQLQRDIIERSPHHIPAMFHMEGLCGGFLQGNMSFPSNINRGSTWDPQLEEQIGRVVSRQEKAAGIHQILAPVLDINRDPRMGRMGETYGEDSTLAAAMGTAFVKGVQEDTRCDGMKAEAVAKHFMGFHNSMGGIHGAESLTPPRFLQEVYGKPFQAAIAEADLRGVMPCYCTFDGEAASSSRRLLTDILRTEMGFDGLSVADYSAVENQHLVQGLYESKAETGLRSMEAGMDMEWPKRSCYNEELAVWFADGEADISVLDTAVERILTAKFRMGLFEHPFALEGEELIREFASTEEDMALSLRCAEESLVLLKNDGTLPIRAGSAAAAGAGMDGETGAGLTIALIGPHAANARSFFGGYTHVSMVEAVHAVANSIAGIRDSGEGSGNAEADSPREKGGVPYVPGTKIQSDETEEFDAILRHIKPGCPSLYEELKRQLPKAEIILAYGYPIAGDDTSYFDEALAAVKRADIAILTLGGKHGSCSVASMGEGVDATDINLPKCQDVFIEAAATAGTPLVGVHFNGRPISSDMADRYLNAVIEAWNPSEMGAKALVNALTGKTNPSGKLPVSVAYRAGQVPVFYSHPNGSSWHQGESIGFPDYVDCPHTPRYCFGHGLSYTTFSYSNLTLDKKETEPFGEIKISCDIANTGNMAGCEVAQLYLKDVHASMVRPCMELAGFVRVELAPGETKRVTFTISPTQTAFLDGGMNWKVEKGKIQVMVGSSSMDIRCRDAFVITESASLDGRNRRFYAKAEQE